MKKNVMKVVTLGTDAIMRYGIDFLPASVRVSTRVYLQNVQESWSSLYHCCHSG
jgi:hypothetical protein